MHALLSPASYPGLSRASMPLTPRLNKDVDGRNKSGHDELP